MGRFVGRYDDMCVSMSMSVGGGEGGGEGGGVMDMDWRRRARSWASESARAASCWSIAVFALLLCSLVHLFLQFGSSGRVGLGKGLIDWEGGG